MARVRRVVLVLAIVLAAGWIGLAIDASEGVTWWNALVVAIGAAVVGLGALIYWLLSGGDGPQKWPRPQ